MRKGKVVGTFLDAIARGPRAEVKVVAAKVGVRLGVALNATLRLWGLILEVKWNH